MAQTIIIDGYNLIHKIPHLKSLLYTSLEQTREQLINLLTSHGIKRNIEIVIVFDGNLMTSSHSLNRPKVKVMFSKPPQKADQLIKSLIEQTKHKRLLTVVSSDREVTRFAKVCGCGVESSEEFYKALKQKPKVEVNQEDKKNRILSKAEVKEWMKIFEGKDTN